MDLSVLGSPANDTLLRRPRLRGIELGDRLPALLMQACRPGTLSWGAAGALATLAIEHRVDAGQPVIARDASAASMWFVLSGTVSLGRRGENGAMQHRRSVEAGGWLDAASALLGGSYIEDAEAQTAAVVCELPAQAVMRAAQTHPSLLPALCSALAAEVADLIDDTRGLMTKDVLSRCATWLLEHAELERADDGRRVGTLRLQQRKRAVAQQLGTTAETFSRTLRQLSKLGLIDVQGYSILLHDIDGLQRLADPAKAKGQAAG